MRVGDGEAEEVSEVSQGAGPEGERQREVVMLLKGRGEAGRQCG